jgi:hypothetical protein
VKTVAPKACPRCGEDLLTPGRQVVICHARHFAIVKRTLALDDCRSLDARCD